MADVYAVAVEGISNLGELDNLSQQILKAARMAVNATTRQARTVSARSMEQQVKFPRGYLTGSSGRLAISKFASDNDLTGTVTGRDRPTSLSRFVVGGARPPGQGAPRGGGLTVEVKPGLAKRMPGAFIIKLKNNNLGLALRSKTPPSLGAKKIDNNLYLLYGASVDQVFNKTREQVADGLEVYMDREFNRLLELKL